MMDFEGNQYGYYSSDNTYSRVSVEYFIIYYNYLDISFEENSFHKEALRSTCEKWM